MSAVELVGAIRDALDLPIPATNEGWDQMRRIAADRAAFLTGALAPLSRDECTISATVAAVRAVHKHYPAAYETEEAGQ